MKEIGLEELHAILLDMMVHIDRFCRDNDIRYSLGGGTLLGAVRHQGFIPWDDDMDIMMPRPDYDRFMATYNIGNTSAYFAMEHCDEPHQRFINGYAKVHDTRTICRERDVTADLRYGVNIDIFPIDGMPDSYWKSKSHIRKCHSAKNRLMNRLTPMSSYTKEFSLPKFLLAHLFSPEFWYRRCNRLMRKYDFETSAHAGCTTGLYRIKERHKRELFENYTELLFEGHSFMAISGWDEYLTGHYSDYMKLPPVEKRVTHSLSAFWKDGEK